MDSYPEGSPEPLPGGTVDRFRIEGPVTTPDRAWRMLGDTDWMNRVAANGEVVQMAVEPQADGFPLLVGELAAPLGMRMPFAEVYSSWLHGRFFRQVRDLRSPLVARSDYRASLEPAPGGVRPVVEMSLTGPGWGSLVRRGLSLTGMERRWAAALATLAGPEDGEGELAPRTLGPEAAAAVARWRGLADAAMVERFERHFRVGRPMDLARMRPFVLADAWALDREAVLDALLGGVEAGATEVFWSVRCVRCYGQVAGGRLLSDLADHADCPACGVRTGTDLGDNVEVVFAPHPSVITALDVNFCTMYPARAPAQHAVLTLAPGARVELPTSLPPGGWRVGAGLGAPDLEVEVGSGGGDRLRWAPDSVGSVQVQAGPVALEVDNAQPRRARVQLTRQGGGTPTVPASLLTTREAYRRRLGPQVLAPDLRIGVRSVALLFTDLSGSTAMYEEIGDAQAFAVVRDHFVLLRAVAAESGGTVVKTIGDAVMAAFFEAPAALTAALAMRDRFAAWAPTLGLANPPALKVGVHVGAALVVHSDQAGLDYFGRTVNLAARAQGAAAAGQVVWTPEVHAHPRVQALLAQAGVVPEAFTRPLKGLGDVPLWRA